MPSPMLLRISPPMTKTQATISTMMIKIIIIAIVIDDDHLGSNVISVSWNSSQGLPQHFLGPEVIKRKILQELFSLLQDLLSLAIEGRRVNIVQTSLQSLLDTLQCVQDQDQDATDDEIKTW